MFADPRRKKRLGLKKKRVNNNKVKILKCTIHITGTNRNVKAMEEGDIGRMPVEEPPPPPDVVSDVRVKVIKPFKPTPRVTRVVRQGKCYYHPAKPASYICSSCGKSVCSVCAQYTDGIYFCPQCAPYKRPTATSQPPADNTSWYRVFFLIGVIIVIIGLLLALFYWPLTSMSAAEFENLEEEYSTDGGHNFKDYREGDVIVIRDTIVRISVEYDEFRYGVITRIWFESTGKGDNDFNMIFDADMERDYNEGDTVYITLHVDEDSRTRDEVIRERYNNVPDLSNIDHSISVDIVYIAMIVFGAFMIFIYVLFMHKVKRTEAKDSLETKDEHVGEGRVESEGLTE